MFFDDKAQEKDEAHIEKDNQEEIAAKHNLNGAVSIYEIPFNQLSTLVP